MWLQQDKYALIGFILRQHLSGPSHSRVELLSYRPSEPQVIFRRAFTAGVFDTASRAMGVVYRALQEQARAVLARLEPTDVQCTTPD